MYGARQLPALENVQGLEFSCSSFSNVTTPYKVHALVRILLAQPATKMSDKLAMYRSSGPPIHRPFFFDAATLSRTLSLMTSRSNWAKHKRGGLRLFERIFWLDKWNVCRV
jgi:hypothetical protein